MGDVGAATTANTDPNALFHNPSKLAFAESNTAISLNYTPWLRNIGVKDANLGYLAGYKKIDERQTIGASLKYFSLGDIPFTNEQGELIQQYRASDFAFDFSYIRNMGTNFAMSLTARYTHSSIGNGNYNGVDVKPGNALSVDVGLYAKKAAQLFNKEGKLAIGANISNLGTKIQYGAQKSFLPANLKIGATADINLNEKSVFSWSVDVNKLLIPENSDLGTSLPSAIGKSFSPLNLSVGTGFEFWYDQLLALRTGYFAAPGKYETQYLTTGFGLKYKLLQFDLSYLISTKSRSAIDNTLRLSLTYQIN
ncbi:type IX secretion system outer membrane channel protein PorV [Mucilaginibacter gynuensis]|uniref:Type IX secretion system outer membrane channel protein PorV n=2 Tax=Mucilaginibacter gynuensis TaxID=1302236 RepID=A0ABP8FX53_9SPHI